MENRKTALGIPIGARLAPPSSSASGWARDGVHHLAAALCDRFLRPRQIPHGLGL